MYHQILCSSSFMLQLYSRVDLLLSAITMSPAQVQKREIKHNYLHNNYSGLVDVIVLRDI